MKNSRRKTIRYPHPYKERFQGQSTPKKPVLEEGGVIDKNISEM